MVAFDYFDSRFEEHLELSLDPLILQFAAPVIEVVAVIMEMQDYTVAAVEEHSLHQASMDVVMVEGKEVYLIMSYVHSYSVYDDYSAGVLHFD